MGKNKKLIILSFFIILMLSFLFSGCGKEKNDDGKIRIVTTVFPQYDFVRAVTEGRDIELKMLLKPGAEAHTYDPTPSDMIALDNCDLFINVGGESEAWADKIILSSKIDDEKILSLMKITKTLEGEHNHDGEEHDEESHSEYDEHVWTSPENAILIVREICERLCQIDKEYSKLYRENTEKYISELNALSEDFRKTAENATRKTLFFADRFPFLHLVREYGIEYSSVFRGCSAQVEASAADIISFIERVKAENVGYIFTVDFSNEKIASTVKAETGAKILKMYSCHTLSADDMDKGITYIDLQKRNLSVIKEALYE